MKVAILTQPIGPNYGGMIQAWALQQHISRIGHDPVTINRIPDTGGSIHRFARILYRVLMKLTGKSRLPIRLRKYQSLVLQNSNLFVRNNIVTSESIANTRELSKHFEREKYDVVIVGSDQVWRPKYSPNIGNYFLDFLEGKDIKRIAYAASFGVDDWEFDQHQTKQCAKLVKCFDLVTVRESSGVELCKHYLGVESVHVLDPTLLLEEADYRQLIGNSRLQADSNGVYTYFLDGSHEKEFLAERVGKKLGCAVSSCQAIFRIGEASLNSHDVEDFVMPDIRDWLAGFANSKFVLTDSFHGVVFAIIFRKPFAVVPNEQRGAARFLSLAEMLGIDKRVFLESGAEVDPYILSEIDYLKISSNVRRYADLSKKTLSDVLA